MLSYKCSARCRHCMYACSPKWEADWISEESLAEGLAGLARTIQPSPRGPNTISPNHGLHFTGGEPFLNYPLLLRGVEMARELRIPSLFAETNCAWCRDETTPRDQLAQLKAAGLHGILISVNPFYAEHVPFERTERCIQVSHELFGQNVFVYQPARAYFHEPCRPAFLRNWHNHIDNYGNLVAGYCGGISLGNWLDIERLV